MKNWFVKNKELIIFAVIVVVGTIVAIQLNARYVDPKLNKAQSADEIV